MYRFSPNKSISQCDNNSCLFRIPDLLEHNTIDCLCSTEQREIPRDLFNQIRYHIYHIYDMQEELIH